MSLRRAPRRRAALGAAALVAVLALSSCAFSDVKAGPGVNSSEIALGVLGDQSGPFKNIGSGLIRGNELWAADVNARGGVCNRKIRLSIGDTSYKADTARTLYNSQKPKVLGFMHILGSPANTNLRIPIAEDGVTALSLAWSSFDLASKLQIVPGATYDLEIINGLSFLQSQGVIKDGDNVGHVYIGGEYGDNALLGSQYYAQAHRLNLLPVKIAATDTDMASIVAGFKRDKVKAIVVTTAPSQTGALLASNGALLGVAVLGNNPTWDPGLLTGAAAAGAARFTVVSSAPPYSSELPKAKEVAQRFTAAYPQSPPTAGVPYGFALGMVWEQALVRACANGDLSRVGVVKAFHELNSVKTDNLIGTMDFTKAGSPATRAVYIARPDAAQKGGLRQLTPQLYQAPEATKYKAPLEKQ